jgi:FG-GAP repeat
MIRARALMTMLFLTFGLSARLPALAIDGAGASGTAPTTATTPTGNGPIFSDFNGDGVADLAIGAPSEGVGTAADAGAVNVLYGSTTGLQAVSPDDQFWTQDSPDIEDQAEEGDLFGWALAGADYNGDGFADLAIGAASEDLPDARNAGALHVLYGSVDGLQATSPEDQFWTQDSPDVQNEVSPEERFGRALRAGDFNADGYADLAIGVPYQAYGYRRNAGGVSVLYGSAAGLQATSPDDQFWSQDSPDVQDKVNTADRFGWAFAVEDFNADGYADLAIGVPMESVEDLQLRAAGAVSVLYGSAGGLQATSPDDQFWTQDSPDVEDQAEGEDRMGWFLAAGDLNGDGYGDLAIGVPFEDLLVDGAGGVNVLYGSAAGLQATAPEDQFWTQDSPDVEDQAEVRDWFGWAVSVGDFNGDGFDDLAASARVEDLKGILNAGAVNVLYGSAAGLQATSPEDQFWNEDSPDVEDQAEVEDEFGWSLDASDLNADGFMDLVIGVPLQDVAGLPDAGAVHVLYSSAAGLQTTSPEDQYWTQDSPDVQDQSEPGDEFGDSFTGGSQCLHPCHAPFPIDRPSPRDSVIQPG